MTDFTISTTARAWTRVDVVLTEDQYFDAYLFTDHDRATPRRVERLDVHLNLLCVPDTFNAEHSEDHEAESTRFWLWVKNDHGQDTSVPDSAFSDDTIAKVNALVEEWHLPTAFTYAVLPSREEAE